VHSTLQGMKQLSRLVLRGSVHVGTPLLAQLPRLPQLEELDCGDCYLLGDAALEALPRCPSLKCLKLDGCFQVRWPPLPPPVTPACPWRSRRCCWALASPSRRQPSADLAGALGRGLSPWPEPQASPSACRSRPRARPGWRVWLG
jgi:hypothetical protein